MAAGNAAVPVRAQVSGRLVYRDKERRVIKTVAFAGTVRAAPAPDQKPPEKPRDGDLP
jgi:hypothetical protein